jgi:hypothetical protein
VNPDPLSPNKDSLLAEIYLQLMTRGSLETNRGLPFPAKIVPVLLYRALYCTKRYRYSSLLKFLADDEAYANSYFLNANSTTQPGIVDANVQPILTRSEVYSGVYGRASINFYAFNSNGNRGIACGLNNLQKIRDGEPLGSRTSAEDDFADFAKDDDFLS